MPTEANIRELTLKGVSRKSVEAFVGHKLTDAELAVFRKAQGERQIRLAEKHERGPMTTAERVRKHVAKSNELPEIPSVADPDRKEACRYDLELFGWTYCRMLLKHRASADIKSGLIHDVQECILHGGKAVKEYGRGTGKTTWIDDIASVWAILYGHRRYVVTIAANGKLAKKNLKRIKRLISRSDEILADFPAVALPIRELSGISQRSASQTYHGQPTDVEWGTELIAMPMLRNELGQPLDAGCGAVIAAVGIGGAVRGANEGGQRPDFLILDDPQTKKTAHSPKLVADTIEYIHQDALFLAGHDRAMSAFVTITPQCYGDVATELTSQSKHPEWSVSIEPFVKSTCPAWSRLVELYCIEYVEDMANHDYSLTRSRAWYLEHRDEFAGCVTIDPEQYDHELEVDDIHHILNLRASLGEIAFNAEIMMQVADLQSEVSINPDMVSNALNGFERYQLPTGTTDLVAFCDVNTKAGANLSCVVTAFGPGRVSAVVDYFRFPETGSLVERNASERTRATAVAQAMHQVVAKVADRHYFRMVGEKRLRVIPTALAFDRGFMPDVIHRVRDVLAKTGYYENGEKFDEAGVERKRKPAPFRLVAMRGFPWNKYGTRKRDMTKRGDHVFATRSQYGEYLAEMAPYWREIMQSGFMETPLMPGSLSLFGRNPVQHYSFAQEVCAEKLVRKYVHPSGCLAWDWATTGPEHFCDAVTGCFALASWFRLYDSTSATVDMAAQLASGRPRQAHQDDLFNPLANPAIGNAPPADDTTAGTGASVDPVMPADLERHFDFRKAKPVTPQRRPLFTNHRHFVNKRKGKYIR